MNSGLLPIASGTIVANPNAGSVSVAVKRGVKYRVVSAANASYLQVNNGAAALNQGVYLPPNVECFFVFGTSDSQGTDPDVRVFAAASTFVFFTPVISVVAG